MKVKRIALTCARAIMNTKDFLILLEGTDSQPAQYICVAVSKD